METDQGVKHTIEEEAKAQIAEEQQKQSRILDTIELSAVTDFEDDPLNIINYIESRKATVETVESSLEDSKKKVVNKTIEELRVRMMAFVDEMLVHTLPQGASDGELPHSHQEAQLKFEIFKVETASRKVLQELLDYFNQRDLENDRIIKEVQEQSDFCFTKMDGFTAIMRKITQQSIEADTMAKRMIRLEQKLEKALEKNTAEGESIADKMKTHGELLDNKMSVLNHYDQRMSNLDQEMAQVRQLAHTFRDKLRSDIYEVEQKMVLLDEKVNYETEKLTSRHDQQRTLLHSFKDSLSQLETNQSVMKKQLKLINEKSESELDRRLVVEDFKRVLRNESLSYLVGQCVAQPDSIDQDKFFFNQRQRTEYMMKQMEQQKQQLLSNKTSLINKHSDYTLSEGLVEQALKKSDYKYRDTQEKIEPFLQDIVKIHNDDQKNKRKHTYIMVAERLRKSIPLTEMRELIEDFETNNEQLIQQAESNLVSERSNKRGRSENLHTARRMMNEQLQQQQDMNSHTMNMESSVTDERSVLLGEIKSPRATGDEPSTETEQGFKSKQKGLVSKSVGRRIKVRDQSRQYVTQGPALNIKDFKEEKSESRRISSRVSNHQNKGENSQILEGQNQQKSQVNNTQNEPTEKQRAQNNMEQPVFERTEIPQMTNVLQKSKQNFYQYMPQQKQEQNEEGQSFSMDQFQPSQLTRLQKKRLAQELKDEMQDLLEDPIELRVQDSIAQEMRRLEMDVEQSKHQSMEKFKTELDSAINRFNMEFEQFKEAVTEEMRILHKQKARDRSDLELMLGKCTKKIKKLKETTSTVKDLTTDHSSIIAILTENMSMQLQNEECEILDKKNIALMGIKNGPITKQDMHMHGGKEHSPILMKDEESGKHHDMPIKIDQKCLSCQMSGHDTSHILNMFKIACLHYVPSNIQYRSNTFTRQEFLKIRRALFEKLFLACKKAQINFYTYVLFIIVSLFQGAGNQPFKILNDIMKADYKEAQTGTSERSTYEDGAKYTSRLSQQSFESLEPAYKPNITAVKAMPFKPQHMNFTSRMQPSKEEAVAKVLNSTTAATKSDESVVGQKVRMSMASPKTVFSTVVNPNSTQSRNFHHSFNQSIDSVKHLSYSKKLDPVDFMKNPNSNIKQLTKEYHNRLKNQSFQLAPALIPKFEIQVKNQQVGRITEGQQQDLPSIGK